MITKLYIPTIKTKDNFEVKTDIDEMSYINMLKANYDKYSDGIEQYMTNGVKQQSYSPYRKSIDMEHIENDVYEYMETQSSLLDMNNQDMTKETLKSYLSSKEMFILILDINPDTIDEDTESELIFWIKESMNINNSQKFNDDDKLLILPKRDLKIDVDNETLILSDCRILDVYSKLSSGKFNFAILVKEIIK